MIDRRRWPSCTATRSSSWLQDPAASGPRWAIRSVMMSTSFCPSACWERPAIPHTSAPGPYQRLGGAAQEAFVDPQVGALLVDPGKLLLDPFPAELAQLRALGLVFHKRDDRLRVLVLVVGRDVDAGVI